MEGFFEVNSQLISFPSELCIW